jgi:PTS system mannose-specific IID component
MTDAKTGNKISKTDMKLLKKLYIRSCTVFAPFNYANQGASGFEYSLMPFIDHYYKKGSEKRRQALKRNIVWYNITNNVGTFCMGLVASMEKQASKHDDYNVNSINSVKASLMGPMSGIGDTLFWGILRVVAAGIAISFGLQGNLLAPIMFLLVYNIPSFIIRWYLAKLGFSVGSDYLQEMYASGLINIFTKAARTLGLIMLGGMTSSLVQFKSKVVFHLGGGQILNLQHVFDQIFKGLLPLCVTLFCYWLITKKKVNFTVVVIGVIIVSIILSFFGIA